jgi:hypothetical protein
MDPDQTARMRRLVWIHAGRKRITLVLTRLKYYANSAGNGLSLFTVTLAVSNPALSDTLTVTIK